MYVKDAQKHLLVYCFKGVCMHACPEHFQTMTLAGIDQAVECETLGFILSAT